MSNFFIRGSLICLATLTSSCLPSVSKDPQESTKKASSATLALFAPDSENPCNSVLPSPTDIIKDPSTGLLNIPSCPNDSEEEASLKEVLRTLDGYSVQSILSVQFSRPIDIQEQQGAVIVINASTGEIIPVSLKFDEEQSNTLYIIPLSFLNEHAQYIAVVTTNLKDKQGLSISSDQAFMFVKENEPIIDDLGYSRFSSLTDIQAYGLEMLRMGYQPLFAALNLMGIERNKIAVAWSFTTQTINSNFGTELASIRLLFNYF